MIRTIAAATLAAMLAACGGSSPKKYTVGGSVSGLSGAGLVLQNNSGPDLGVSASGAFTFSGTTKNGQGYSVAVRTQPTNPSQTCVVSNGAGTVQGANVTNVSVSCTTNNYQVGGTVSGLAGAGLSLQNNGGNNLNVSANGAFQFTGAIPSGQPYAVTVLTQPTNPSQTCTVTSGSGNVQGTNVASVSVACTTNTYRVGGTVTGLAGGGLTLQNNGANNLAISANGAFQFSTAVPSNGAYAATVSSQPTAPWQTCVVGNASGTVTNGDVSNITIACTTNTYALRGTVSGLSPSQFREPLVLANGSDEVELMNNGSFAMANVPSGQAFNVVVGTQPLKPALTCTVQQGSGAVVNGEITSVAVTCGPTEATFVYATSFVEQMATVGTPMTVTVDPSGQFVYLGTMDAQGTILAYSIDAATGRLTQIGSGIVTGASPNEIITDPSGEFVFVANLHGGPTNQGSVSVFQVDSITGGLTEVPGSEFTNGQSVREIGTDRTGQFVYTANAGSANTSGFRVDRTTGVLTALPGSPYAAGNVPFSVAVDPLGRFVYTMTGSTVAGIFGYAVDPASGELTQLPGSPFAFPTENRIVAHPTGNFLYHFDRTFPTPHIAGYAIGASGALTLIAGSPFADPNYPESAAFDPTGRFMYVTVEAGGPTGGGVKVYNVDTVSGALSAVSATPTEIATNPTSIAVR
jgi:6-phosphogluconolactonase (cycloisomerase 2 family)